MGLMNKRGLWCMLALLALLPAVAVAQTWNEFFRQKKTQRRYLAEQIAALKVYGDYLQKGYEVVSTGLAVIGEVTGGEHELHVAFFASLKAVRPVIGRNEKVREVAAFVAGIQRAFHELKGIPDLSAGHRAYIRQVARLVLKECAQDLGELLVVTAAGELQLSDDERLFRLDALHRRLREKFTFTRRFLEEVMLYLHQQVQLRSELENLNQFYAQ